MSRPSRSSTPAPEPDSAVCTICCDEVSDASNERTAVKLRCSHVFHLDCIGSAFNASGKMQCPNCRRVEKGEWRCFNYYEYEGDYSEDEDVPEDDLLSSPTIEEALVRLNMGFPYHETLHEQWPFGNPHPTHYRNRNEHASMDDIYHQNYFRPNQNHTFNPLGARQTPSAQAVPLPNIRTGNSVTTTTTYQFAASQWSTHVVIDPGVQAWITVPSSICMSSVPSSDSRFDFHSMQPSQAARNMSAGSSAGQPSTTRLPERFHPGHPSSSNLSARVPAGGSPYIPPDHSRWRRSSLRDSRQPVQQRANYPRQDRIGVRTNHFRGWYPY